MDGPSGYILICFLSLDLETALCPSSLSIRLIVTRATGRRAKCMDLGPIGNMTVIFPLLSFFVQYCISLFSILLTLCSAVIMNIVISVCLPVSCSQVCCRWGVWGLISGEPATWPWHAEQWQIGLFLQQCVCWPVGPWQENWLWHIWQHHKVCETYICLFWFNPHDPIITPVEQKASLMEHQSHFLSKHSGISLHLFWREHFREGLFLFQNVKCWVKQPALAEFK